jgi:hypothetical protein
VLRVGGGRTEEDYLRQASMNRAEFRLQPVRVPDRLKAELQTQGRFRGRDVNGTPRNVQHPACASRIGAGGAHVSVSRATRNILPVASMLARM